MTSSSKTKTAALATSSKITGWVQRQIKRDWVKISLAGLWLSFVAAHVATDSVPVQLLERRLQTVFFDIRGPLTPPDDIVILAMDDESFGQAEYYRADPEQYSYFAPISGSPWQRTAHAIVIERLLEAGAEAVAVDILMFSDSSYGPADDQALADVLARYGDRVVLATTVDDANMSEGEYVNPTRPLTKLLNTPVYIGNVNFPRELDGRIHRHGRAYLNDLIAREADLDRDTIESEVENTQSFAEATLDAAGVSHPLYKGDFMDFYGPTRSFTHIPFWHVLDPDPWANYLDNGRYFEDKIVLIGGTAKFLQDFHQAPFSETLLHPETMAGVEILATDIANLRDGQALRVGIPNPWLRGLLVLGSGAGFVLLLRRFNRPIARLGWTAASLGGWFWVSYGAFVGAGLLLPTGAPIVGLMVLGSTYIVADIVTEQLRKQRLRQTLEQYVTSPIVQEIISQQDDLQDLLKLREAEVIGLLLANRYRIVRLLGSGGFGETYVAEDTQRPGSPICVVKQLRIISDDPRAHRLGRRFFQGEAETLEKLGHHPQIPRLLAYFEAQNSFYLVEEMIEGCLLKDELASRRPMPQAYVLDLLLGLLPVVAFVHDQGVIHRDIKPSNIIRREADGQLVLIDFGAVKLISNKLADTGVNLTSTSTIGVGTQGYMPSEQSAGLPKFGSDLYALGITAIEALTGIPAYALRRDVNGELLWRHEAPNLDPRFGDIVTRLVLYDFTDRYQRAEEVLADLSSVEVVVRSQPQPEGLPASGGDTVVGMPPYGVRIESVATDNMDDPEAAEDDTRMLPGDWFATAEEASSSDTDTGTAEANS
ncbi:MULTISPECIES: serine/threonine-protein kinase [Cyanophyceae]|uniref:non-specific serine/threonine protein kinase n=1 Tax=Leptolyngbya subtilissima DQ-A4 TaxID=2933933 RepID=A0ABV0K2J6_9CYAN|nr:serine/threonine-protein kinase [Nodosilinea sp. FACHB-141]MBD2110922.1 CHASE2 domain-containing protein [Nodosilinea sp. FACHB-141]